jgi:molybdate transport system substrate-binding protein
MWLVFIKNSVFILIALPMLLSCKQNNRELSKIYLASSLAPMTKDFEALSTPNINFDLVYLSSSAIAKQLEQGAPCDVAMVADEVWSEYLIKKGLVEPRVHFVASNRLVLAGRQKNSLKPVHEMLFGLAPTDKLIIADPDFVPLGSYTKEALVSLGLWPLVSNRLIKAHSARAAGLLLEQQAASVAILFRTDAINNSAVHIVSTIDPSLHRPIRYYVLTCKGARKERATYVKNEVLSPSFQNTLMKKGFDVSQNR